MTRESTLNRQYGFVELFTQEFEQVTRECGRQELETETLFETLPENGFETSHFESGRQELED
jgi:hypothetical protein